MRPLHILKYMLVLCLLGNVLSCEDSSVKVEMLAYDPISDEMIYKVNTVETLADLGKLEGRATRLRGGVSIILDYLQEEVRWDRVGTPVAFSAVRIDDVYYPTDFDSLAMISVYYNIEQAMLFFESIGMPTGYLGRLDTYYRADVIEKMDPYIPEPEESVDNAFYLSISETDRGFYILPFAVEEGLINGVPLSMNPGVIAHEYSHAVFQESVYDKLPGYGIYMNEVNYGYLWALNEGIADLFAVALTGDPNFINPSISFRGVSRDASDVIIYDSSFDRNIINASQESFDPYQIGAFFSAAVYEMARRIQGLAADGPEIPKKGYRHLVAKATYNAIHNLGKQGAGQFEPADFFSYFVTQFEPGQASIICGVLIERFSIYYSEVDGCSAI
ncbi:MAG: hypothetical protein JXX14_01945 [Deltaproteobacteria bacterium]|nr:hypothetical protein [Deltaproteobacteria bacterium]